MGAKKKSKTNKLARMSEEEKLRYLQQRAAIEEEARRRKEQLISTFMKNKLKREDAFSRLNSAKINQQWRQTLRQIKNNELHEAAETLHQTFDVAVQTKNKIIDTLLADLGNSVAMHNLAVQTHLESINKIIEIEEERLERLHEAYEADREGKMKEAEASRSRGYQTFDEHKGHLDIDMHWQSLYHESNETRIRNLAEDFRNDYKYKALSETKKEEEECASKIEELQIAMKETMRNYNKALSPYIDHYKQLREVDMNDTEFQLNNMKIIRDQEDKLRKAKRIKESTDELLRKIDEDFNKIMNEKQLMFEWIRTELKKEQSESDAAIKHLSTSSNTAVKFLESILNKVNEITNVNQSCQKYLSEEELYCQPKVINSLSKLDLTEISDKDILEETRCFWQRYSKVLSEMENLSAHHGSLIDENAALKHSLIKYMKTLGKPSSLTSCLYRDINRQ